MTKIIRSNRIFERAVTASTISDAIMASDTFENGDLSSGVLTINHGKNTQLISVIIRDTSGVNRKMSDEIIDDDNTSVDFGGDIGAGTWTWFVIASI